MGSLPVPRIAAFRKVPTLIVTALVVAFQVGDLARAQCPEWSSGFHPGGATGAVRAQLVRGTGLAETLVVGGEFGAIGSTVAHGIAEWDGSTWSPIGGPLPAAVHAIAEFDNGGGPTIFVGGPNFVAFLSGGQWNVLPAVGTVSALHVFDDGMGDALFAAGDLLSIQARQVRGIGRLQGSWTAPGGFLGGEGIGVTLETHDDGSGPALYVGGRFTAAGGTQARNLARWDGASWSPVGGGLDGSLSPESPVGVTALLSVTNAAGTPELHVGGAFTEAGGLPTSPWAIWSGGAWIDAGGSEPPTDFTVRVETTGNSVCAATFQGIEQRVAGAGIVVPITGSSGALSVRAFGTNVPQDLFVGLGTPGDGGSYLVTWDGTSFVAPFETGGLTAPPSALARHDFGPGEELVAISTGALRGASRAAAFDGTDWRALDDAGLEALDPAALRGHAGQLYAAGTPAAGNGPAVLRLEGTTWNPVGSTLSGTETVFTLASFDGGSGPELFAGGRFDQFGGTGTAGLARFDGTDWVSVGGGITSLASTIGAPAIHATLVWNDGTGPALYVAGTFEEIGGVAALNIARWDGTDWSPLAGGLDCQCTTTLGVVQDLTILDGPNGEQLVAGGSFRLADGQPALAVAAWDGTVWTSLGAGLERSFGSLVLQGSADQLVAFDSDGTGESLFAYGSFDFAGGLPVDRAAVWDGTSWQSTDVAPADLNRAPLAAEFDDGQGRALYLAGDFGAAGGVPASHVAAWSDPCGNILGYPGCTANVNSAGTRATLRGSGSLSIAADDLTLSVTGLPLNGLTLFFRGTEGIRQPLGDGTLCVGGTLVRMAPAGSSGTTGAYSIPFDHSASYASGVQPGTTLYLQAFFRDGAGGPAGFSGSDSLRVQFRP